jgi:hypothetical protein
VLRALLGTGAQQFTTNEHFNTVAGKWQDWAWVDGTDASNLNCGGLACNLWSQSGGSANREPKYVAW